MNLEDALIALYARVPLGMRMGLDAMRVACAAMGHPEASFEAVHIAGTNGKGSVSAMVESIARAGGKRTGLYTSPHLCRFAERVRIDGEPISDDALADLLTRVLAAGPDLSFFETATLVAFVAFREAKVDLAVIEVGIGGRLDATNVLPHVRASAITRVALDHMNMLGNTLVEIAREKAAIAKLGVPFVLGSIREPEVRAAILEVTSAAGANVIDAAGEDARDALACVNLGLEGAHQEENAAVAYRLARLLGFSESTILAGLHDVKWPGRLERIDADDGTYILDGAHNPDGAAALAKYLLVTRPMRDARAAAEPIVLLFGTLADKAWPPMLDLLAQVTPHRVYVAPQGRAATPLTDLANRHPGQLASSVAEARKLARTILEELAEEDAFTNSQRSPTSRSAVASTRSVSGTSGTRSASAPSVWAIAMTTNAAKKPHGIVVVCGSIYLVGEMRGLLLDLPRDPPVAL